LFVIIKNIRDKKEFFYRTGSSVILVAIFFKETEHQPTLLVSVLFFAVLEETNEFFSLIESHQVWRKSTMGIMNAKIILAAFFLHKMNRDYSSSGTSEDDEIYRKIAMADWSSFPEKSIILAPDSVFHELTYLKLLSNFRDDIILIRRYRSCLIQILKFLF